VTFKTAALLLDQRVVSVAPGTSPIGEMSARATSCTTSEVRPPWIWMVTSEIDGPEGSTGSEHEMASAETAHRRTYGNAGE
jgi:hypothetical protein